MEEQKPTPQPKRNFELIAAIGLGVLAVACFVVQALTLSSTTPPRETVLFNLLQFLLTIGFTWFSTRAVSRSEFEQSLKRFAISAYRRITDIERLITRLQSEVRGMIAENEEGENHNLYIVDAIVSDTCQVVRSSISDWSDVIGDELLAIEKIKRLEQEKVEISHDSQAALPRYESEAIREINKQIAELKSSLPARLQFEARGDDRSLEHERHAARWIADKHNKENGYRFTIVSGGIYPHERDCSTLKPGEVLHVVKAVRSIHTLDVADDSGARVGRVRNNTPLRYAEFVKALEDCYGTLNLSLEFIGPVDKREFPAREGIPVNWVATFMVRMLQEPVIGDGGTGKRKTD